MRSRKRSSISGLDAVLLLQPQLPDFFSVTLFWVIKRSVTGGADEDAAGGGVIRVNFQLSIRTKRQHVDAPRKNGIASTACKLTYIS